MCEVIVCDDIQYEFFFPMCDRKKKYLGTWHTVRKPMFPGYLFIETSDIDILYEELKKEEGMVNIYLFYGRECPHCEKLMEYLDDINNKYGDKFNLYGFEIWHNSDNANLMKKFLETKGDKSSGIPYYIIGDESFVGYNYTYDEKIIDAIEKYSSSDNDIYFDKIRK